MLPPPPPPPRSVAPRPAPPLPSAPLPRALLTSLQTDLAARVAHLESVLSQQTSQVPPPAADVALGVPTPSTSTVAVKPSALTDEPAATNASQSEGAQSPAPSRDSRWVAPPTHGRATGHHSPRHQIPRTAASSRAQGPRRRLLRQLPQPALLLLRRDGLPPTPGCRPAAQTPSLGLRRNGHPLLVARVLPGRPRRSHRDLRPCRVARHLGASLLLRPWLGPERRAGDQPAGHHRFHRQGLLPPGRARAF